MTVFQTPEQRAAAVVQPGENVVWTGAAPRGLRFYANDLFMIPFSLFWSGFVLYTAVRTAMVNPTSGALLFMLPFVVAAIYLLFGRFAIDMAFRARTSYSLTDRAAYVSRTGFFPAVRRYAGSALDSTEFQPKANGYGTIRFERAGWFGMNGTQAYGPPTLDRFDSIPDARRVYGLVLEARKAN